MVYVHAQEEMRVAGGASGDHKGFAPLKYKGFAPLKYKGFAPLKYKGCAIRASPRATRLGASRVG